MELPLLLAIIEVPYEARVRCSAPGCGHTVYKRVHVLRLDGVIRIFGSSCFAREFADSAGVSRRSRYTGSNCRMLSDEERLLLVSNTERLIERFEAEQAAALELQKKQRQAPRFEPKRPTNARQLHIKSQFTDEERASVEPEALKVLTEKLPGLNFYSAGFNGLLQSEIERMLRAKKAACGE